MHDPGITDPRGRWPIEEAPHDGTIIQVGGPYEWVRCLWNDGSAYLYNVNRFVLYCPGHHKDGNLIDMKSKNFWRPDDGKG